MTGSQPPMGTTVTRTEKLKLLYVWQMCDACGVWYKMNGETTKQLKNSHLQNILTSVNT